MAQNEKQKNLSRIIESEFLKRSVTKLIVSVSVLFSLFFSLSQSTLISFVHHFNFYFSTLPFKLLSHNLDKNYTFLLCNGLLVFLAGLFSLSSPPPSSSNKSESFKNYEDDLQPQVTIMDHQVPLMEQEAELENTETQQEQNAMQKEYENIKSDQAEETETEMFEEEKHEEQEEKEEEEISEAEAEAESSFFIEEVDDEEEEEEEEGGGGNDKLSNEELNKKFDDFIRKMKEELRIEARQQLIMV